MNQFVLMLSVGPVQGFISAARRSRDLWSGSWLLSEMAKASAHYLYEHKAQMVFPYITTQTAPNLQAGSDFSVGNKIQVLVEAASIDEVRQLAQAASNAAKARFKEVANEAKARLGNKALRADMWDQQVDDYVEVQSAWARIASLSEYKQTCDQVSAILAARKATRDFKPAALSAYDAAAMLPKSSLDGMRETVIKEGDLSQTLRRQLGLNDSEQLDCAGVLKRLGGQDHAEQFTPVTRVAAHAWLAKLSAEQRQELCTAYEPLVGLELATRVKGNKNCYQDFPYDAQFVYRFRLEASAYKSNSEEQEALQALKNVLLPLWRAHGEPSSYGVLLLADGDRMGELLDKANDVNTHQTITAALSDFAGSVAATMREFNGHCIYAGGDDVLGFVPLHEAYDCAQSLAQRFHQALAPVAKELHATAPTLSVGLAISHINTPLGHVRQLAQQAEKFAKGDHVEKADLQRNALGITLAIRSGNTTHMRLRWDDQNAHQALQKWVEAYLHKTIPSRVAYDTREVYLRTDFHTMDPQDDLLEKIRRAEFKLMLMKARTNEGKVLAEDLIQALNERALKVGSLNDLANELIIARWLAAKTQKDLGKV